MAGAAVELTSKCLWDAGPLSLHSQYWEDYSTPPGNMWRLQASAGPHKTDGDAHIAGRALDVILRVKFADEKADADKIVGVVSNLRQQMGLIAIIYNHQEWGSQGPAFPRRGANNALQQHETHIISSGAVKSIT